jgi:hypothetical protein
MKKSSLSEKIGVILICLLVLVSLIGTFLKDKSYSGSIINEAKANEITSIPNNMNMTGCGVRYERIYAYGHTFIVFSSASGGDIEVLVEN